MNNYLDVIENTEFASGFKPKDHVKYYRRSHTVRAVGTGIYGSKYRIKFNKKMDMLKKIDLKVSVTTDVNMTGTETNLNCFFCKRIDFNQQPQINLASMQSEYLLSRKNEDVGTRTNSFKQASQNLQFDGASLATNAWFFINLPLSMSELQSMPQASVDDLYLDLYINDSALKMGFAAGTEVTSFSIDAIVDYFQYPEPVKIDKFLGYNCYYEIKKELSLAGNTITKVSVPLTCKNPVYNIAALCLKDGSTNIQANVLSMKIMCENETIKEMYKLVDFYYNQDLQGYVSNSQYKAWLSDEKSRANLDGLFPTGSSAVYELELEIKSPVNVLTDFTLHIMCEYPYVYDVKKKQFQEI